MSSPTAAEIGTLNMDAWSASATGEGSAFGIARHPLGERRLRGGSPNGAGVALAARIVNFAVGGDTAGSARIPASWCGVVALNPTAGAVPSEGAVGLDPSLDAVCPMDRTVRDCATLFEVAAARGADGGPARTVAVVAESRAQAEEASRAALGSAADALRERGCRIFDEVRAWVQLHGARDGEGVLFATGAPLEEADGGG